MRTLLVGLGCLAVLVGVGCALAVVVAMTAGTHVYQGAVRVHLRLTEPDGPPSRAPLYGNNSVVFQPDAQGNYELPGRFKSEMGSIVSVVLGTLTQPKRLAFTFYELPDHDKRHEVVVELDGFSAGRTVADPYDSLLEGLVVDRLSVSSTGPAAHDPDRPTFAGELWMSARLSRALGAR